MGSYYDLEQRRQRPRWQGAALLSGGFVALLWVLELVDTLLLNRLDRLGVQPGSSDGLMGVLFAPLLHLGFGHLASNTVPLLVLGFLVALNGLSRWAAVTITIWVVSGVGTWVIGGWGSVHIGASGLLFGYLVYLVVRGVVSRRPWQIVVGVLVFLVYGSILWGVLPTAVGISWQMHLFGAIGGGIAAWWFDKPPRRAPQRLY